MNKSSEQFSNVVTPPLFPNQHSPNSYSVISITEIDFVIPKIFEFHRRRNKLEIAMTKYLELIITHDGGVSEELKSLLTCFEPSTSQ